MELRDHEPITINQGNESSAIDSNNKSKKIPKTIMFLLIFLVIISVFFLKPRLTGNAIASYEEDGKLSENINYKSKDINIVFITIDALRADHLGCYGYERDTSPNIDEFAKDSLIFNKAYVQWPRTIPSMTSIFSSTYAHTNSVMRTEKISEELVMLPEILKNNGYSTFGAVNNPVLSKEFNLNQGFDEYVVIGENQSFFELSDAQKLTEETINWIEKNKDEKFFAWLHYMDPHAPYNSALKHKEHDIFFDEEYSYKLTRYVPIGDYALLGIIPNSSYLEGANLLDYYVAEYDAEIHYSDKWVGRLLDYLEKSGLKDNTLIILTADHGESLTDHNYYFNHGDFVYDASIHVPLIMSYPKKFKKGTINTQVPSIDLAPTILDLLNIPLSNTFEGYSLLPLIYENKTKNNFIFAESGGMNLTGKGKLFEISSKSIRNDKYKLISNVITLQSNTITKNFFVMNVSNDIKLTRFTPPDYELYDSINDSGETNNLLVLNNPKFNKIGENLLEELERWFKENIKNHNKYSSEGIPELSEEKLEAIKSLGYLN